MKLDIKGEPTFLLCFCVVFTGLAYYGGLAFIATYCLIELMQAVKDIFL